MAQINYKSKGVRTIDPFPKETIPLNKLDWEVSMDRSTIRLISLEFLENKKYNSDNFLLGIYASDSSNDYLFSKPINEVNDFPIIFNIKKYGWDELSGSANFKVIILDKNLRKRIVAETTEIKLVPKADIQNLLEVRAKNLGKRIAELDMTSTGPILSINKNIVTSKGRVNLKTIELIVQTDPIFLCSYFPNILNEIFSNAFLEQKKIQWAKDWIGFAEELVPSVFKDFKVTQYANILEMKKDPQFQNALNELSDTWITQNKLDKNLFEKFKKI